MRCDRLGGKAFYGPSLAKLFPGARVTAPCETSERSVYKISQGKRRMVVRFLVEGDDKSFPEIMIRRDHDIGQGDSAVL